MKVLKGESSECEAQLPNLPQEVIAEILSWLPVKSVCRFRCVSKHFLSLLSDPQFSRTHLDRVLRNDAVRFRSQRILLPSKHMYSPEHGSFEGDCDSNCVELGYSLKERDWIDKLGRRLDVVNVLGSSNGLVCVSPPAQNVVILVNPTTKESKMILESSIESSSDSENDVESYRLCFDSYGFGFDSVHEDYKVVRIVPDNAVTALVYSLKYDSWREIGHLQYDFESTICFPGVSLNGFIHWMVFYDGKHVIAAFDLSNEIFLEIPVPDDLTCMHPYAKFVIGVYDKCLCIVYRCGEMHDDIWLMREYGSAESWTRVRMSKSYKNMEPVCSWKNGKALLQIDRKFILYDSENGTSKPIMVNGFRSLNNNATSYVESLMSPNNY